MLTTPPPPKWESFKPRYAGGIGGIAIWHRKIQSSSKSTFVFLESVDGDFRALATDGNFTLLSDFVAGVDS